MKKIYDSFCNSLECWPVFRWAFVFALIVSFIEIVALAITDQFTGSISSTHKLNLLFWHWTLPFTISRLWDIVTLPLFMYLTFLNERHREEVSFETFDPHYGAEIIDLTQVCLFGAMVGSSVFGILYFIHSFIVAGVLFYILAILTDIWSRFKHLQTKEKVC